ncbi:hypothetical protein RHGRI_014462 [Rhododendron griersonianum]|uniref:Retrotransposon gag domain-containing protein n=1 Tax=Rhododendron griersonianum TaxID=479676 RepID=A0AAV6K9R5_9ERIC|nr:hypothetical protein RHGRI_014462 [Rhododendron griersonianum]
MAVLIAKMAKLEETVSKVEKIGAGGLDMDRLCPFPNARLPERFKMPDFVKFDGSGDPKTHLLAYHSAMKLHRIEEETMAQLFPQTLTGPAFQWFLSLDLSKRKNWVDIGAAFNSQYSYNVQLKMTTRELESTKMGAKEPFADFIQRWRAKAAKMTDRPSEKDQIRIISRNLQPDFAKNLVLVQGANWETFFDSGLAIEEALQNGVIPRTEAAPASSTSKSKPRVYTGSSTALFGGSSYANATTASNTATTHSSSHTADVNQVQAPQKPRNRNQPRVFANFEAPLSAVLEKLAKSGHLRPLAPTPLPQNPPPSHNPNAFYAYHQMPSHYTDSCYRLRHAIQDLVDNGTLPNPPSKPNVISNSLPKHHNQVGQISLSSTITSPNSTIFNPTDHITPADQPKPVVPVPLELEVLNINLEKGESSKSRTPLEHLRDNVTILNDVFRDLQSDTTFTAQLLPGSIATNPFFTITWTALDGTPIQRTRPASTVAHPPEPELDM